MVSSNLIPFSSLLIFIAQEKKLVEEVFNNAIDCLSDEDKALPQVRIHALLDYFPNINLAECFHQHTGKSLDS